MLEQPVHCCLKLCSTAAYGTTDGRKLLLLADTLDLIIAFRIRGKVWMSRKAELAHHRQPLAWDAGTQRRAISGCELPPGVLQMLKLA